MGLKASIMPGSLQDTYLAEVRRQGVAVTIYLVNGFQLRGVVKGFDPFTILIEFERKTHLIYKHAVSTISPQGPFATPAGDAAAVATPAPAEVTTS
jgi:host factor-I protein